MSMKSHKNRDYITPAERIPPRAPIARIIIALIALAVVGLVLEAM